MNWKQALLWATFWALLNSGVLALLMADGTPMEVGIIQLLIGWGIVAIIVLGCYGTVLLHERLSS